MEGIGNASDAELAECLRTHDPEQFHTLVRMHLSFLLDLSTDDSSESSVTERSWLRTLRPGWLSLARKARGAPARMAAIPLTQQATTQVYQLIEFLSREHNLCQEGIFRRSGSVLRQQELKQRVMKGAPLHLDQGHFTVHDCASVLKGFLAELPESLLTDAHYPAYCHIAELCASGGREPPRLLLALQLLLLLLPEGNRALLRELLRLLNLAASRPSNKMAADTLATLFTPHLLCPRKLSPEEFHVSAQTMSRVVAFMIQQGPALFQIPVPLAVDVRAYWLERHKRRLSQQGDGTEASTVFSFVDRERSVESRDANPTQVALAQLYAHVQALPDSSHKRRLLKQFQRRQPALSSSLASCIKRHIFSRAKRRGPGMMSAVHSLSTPGSPGPEASSSDDGSGPLCGSLLRSRRSQSVVRQRRPPRPRVTSLTYQEEASETMMTPRCRKPVLLVSGSNICHLAEGETSADVGSAQSDVGSAQSDVGSAPSDVGSAPSDVGSAPSDVGSAPNDVGSALNDVQAVQISPEHDVPSDAASNCTKVEASDEVDSIMDEERPEISRCRLCCADSGGGSGEDSCSTCGGSLTSVFRSYLLSRSVLTASPVDLSFSSRTDDYDSCNEGAVPEEELLAESFQQQFTSSREPLHETSF